MKQLSLVVIIILYASTAYALDLAGMQDMALKNRKIIQRYVSSLEQSEKDILLAKGEYYPSVDIFYTVNSLDEQSSFESRENSTAAGRLSWNLFSGFADKYNLQSATLLNEVARYRLKGIEQDIQLDVALSYLGVYERRANLKVAESSFQTLEKVYRDGESRYQVGLIGKNELLKFRVDYDNADITKKAAGAGLKKSVQRLSFQVGSDIDFSILDFGDFASLPAQIDQDAYSRKMLAERSEIKALETTIEATASQEKSALSEYYPRIDAVGSYHIYDDDYINGNGSVSEDELRGQLVMSMNLFQGFRTEAGVSKAKLQTRSLRYDLEELRNLLTTDLDNLFIDFQVSLENVDVADRSIEQAEENLRITQLKYDEGMQRETDLLDAITNLSRAQYNYVAVLRTLFSNYFQLTRMVGGF
jgi:outer membrane protein